MVGARARELQRRVVVVGESVEGSAAILPHVQQLGAVWLASAVSRCTSFLVGM